MKVVDRVVGSIPEMEQVEDTVGVNADRSAGRRVVGAIACGMDELFRCLFERTAVLDDRGIDALSTAAALLSFPAVLLDVFAIFCAAAGLAGILLRNLLCLCSVRAVRGVVRGIRSCSSSLVRRHVVTQAAGGVLSTCIVRG